MPKAMRRFTVSSGADDFDVFVPNDVDLDDEFTAICAETGETLRIRGWMCDIEEHTLEAA